MSKRLQDLLTITDTIDTSVMLVKDNQTGVFQDQGILVTDLLQHLIPKVDAPLVNPSIYQIMRLTNNGSGLPAIPAVSGKFLTEMDTTISNATNTTLGKTKLSDSITSPLTALSGHTAASPYAVKLVNDKKPDTAGTETITGTWSFNKAVTHKAGFIANASSIINAHLELNQDGIKTVVEGTSAKGSGIFNVTNSKGIYLPNTIAPQYRDGSNYHNIYHAGYKPTASDVGLSNLSKNSDGTLKIQATTGYTTIGSQSTTMSHFDTDREGFHFSKKILVNGDIASYKHQDTRLADNGQIFELGQRVYSPNNIPTPSTLGAYTKSEVDSRDELRLPKAIQNYDPDEVKASREILIGTTTGDTAGLQGARGFIHLPVSTKNAVQLGLRSTNQEYAIRGVGNNGTAGAWTKIYHTGFKPTSADVGAYSTTQADSRFVNITGDTITGVLNLNSGALHIGGIDVIGSSGDAVRFGCGTFNRGLNFNAKSGLAYIQTGVSTKYRVYHEGFKPSWGDIQSKPKVAIQDESATFSSLAVTEAGLLKLGSWSVNNATSGNLTIAVGSGVKSYITPAGDFHSASLWDNGARVYSKNNNPSWGDIQSKPNIVVQNSASTLTTLTLGRVPVDDVLKLNASTLTNQETVYVSFHNKTQSKRWGYFGFPRNDNPSWNFVNERGGAFNFSGTAIEENGHRVYSPNNKPTPSDIGALPLAGKAADSEKLNGLDESNYALVSDVPSATNLRTVGRDGFYRLGVNITDSPNFVVDYGQLIVSKGDNSDTALQIVSDYKSVNIAWRSYNKTGAGTWNNIYHSGKKPTTADITGTLDYGTF